MIETDKLLEDLDRAKGHLCLTRDRLKAIPSNSPEFQGAMLAYLHAVVSHMSIVSVAQAKQHQDLSEEVDRLGGEMNDLRARLKAIGGPRLV